MSVHHVALLVQVKVIETVKYYMKIQPHLRVQPIADGRHLNKLKHCKWAWKPGRVPSTALDVGIQFLAGYILLSDYLIKAVKIFPKGIPLQKYHLKVYFSIIVFFLLCSLIHNQSMHVKTQHVLPGLIVLAGFLS